MNFQGIEAECSQCFQVIEECEKCGQLVCKDCKNYDWHACELEEEEEEI